jgi:chromatin remodeling complex protein RSC6
MSVEVKGKRKKPTAIEHLQHYEDLLNYLTTEIDRKCRNMEPGVRTLRKTKKKLLLMRKELPKLRLTKKTFAGEKKEATGLSNPMLISEELADFLQVDSTTLLSRLEVNRAICVYCHLNPDEKREGMLRWSYLNNGRDLRNPNNKRLIIPDDSLSDLLRYPEYVEKVKRGEIIRKKKLEDGSVISKVATDSSLTYLIMPTLLNIHLLSPDEIDDD